MNYHFVIAYRDLLNNIFACFDRKIHNISSSTGAYFKSITVTDAYDLENYRGGELYPEGGDSPPSSYNFFWYILDPLYFPTYIFTTYGYVCKYPETNFFFKYQPVSKHPKIESLVCEDGSSACDNSGCEVEPDELGNPIIDFTDPDNKDCLGLYVARTTKCNKTMTVNGQKVCIDPNAQPTCELKELTLNGQDIKICFPTGIPMADMKGSGYKKACPLCCPSIVRNGGGGYSYLIGCDYLDHDLLLE